MWKPTQFFLVYPEDALQRGKTLPAISPMIPREILFQKISCGFFAARKVLNFQPKHSAQDSMESLCKFCSKKSNAVFSLHAKFSARRVSKIPSRACGILFPKSQLRLFRLTQSFPPEESAQDSMESLWKFCSKTSTAIFSPHAKFSAKTECPRFHGEPVEIQTSQSHHVHVQWQMHLLYTTEVNASLLPSRVFFLVFCWNLCLASLLWSEAWHPH